MIIRISSKFEKSYKKLPKIIQEKAKEKERLFRKNPFNPRLKTHKLHGEYKDYWAFSVSDQYRIMFTFINLEIIDFINIGTHQIYK